jgi:hypothetical protein
MTKANGPEREATRRRLKAYLADMRRAGIAEAEVFEALGISKTKEPAGDQPSPANLGGAGGPTSTPAR